MKSFACVVLLVLLAVVSVEGLQQNKRIAQRKFQEKRLSCEMCLEALDYVRNHLPTTGAITEDMVKELLSEACEGLEWGFVQYCHSAVDALLRVAVDEIVKEGRHLDATKICEEVKMC